MSIPVYLAFLNSAEMFESLNLSGDRFPRGNVELINEKIS
jgi:hypothetical protein